MGYTAYVLSDTTRNFLKKMFPPIYKRFIGHHITVKFGVNKTYPLPNKIFNAYIHGYLNVQNDKNSGLECFIVSIDGKTRKRDGSFYHITWSLDPSKYKPVDSNYMIKNYYDDIEFFDNPIKINVNPEYCE